MRQVPLGKTSTSTRRFRAGMVPQRSEGDGLVRSISAGWPSGFGRRGKAVGWGLEFPGERAAGSRGHLCAGWAANKRRMPEITGPTGHRLQYAGPTARRGHL